MSGMSAAAGQGAHVDVNTTPRKRLGIMMHRR
jgi:hypothetical protein